VTTAENAASAGITSRYDAVLIANAFTFSLG